MSSTQARVGVIGCGWWSTYTHIPEILGHPSATLVAICDRSEEALSATNGAYGSISTYTDHCRMLEDEQLDGVVVSVSHNAHYEVARDCLKAGLHVMLEKPMALEASHARALLSLADHEGCELIVGYPYHYTDTTRRAREILQSGQLGAIQYVSCVFASMVVEFYRGNDEAYRAVFNYPVTGPRKAYTDAHQSGGGQGHLQVTHSAGSLLYITGLQPQRVCCFMENWDVPVDLVNALTVQFVAQNGTPAVGVLGSTGNIGVGDGGQMDIRVYCEQGYLILEQIQGMLWVKQHDGREQRYGPLAEDDRYPRFATTRNLVEVILGQTPNGSPAQVGVRVVELLDAAYRSASQDGSPIQV